MAAPELIRQAIDLRLKLRVHPDGALGVYPNDRCPAGFMEQLRKHKPEILEWLPIADPGDTSPLRCWRESSMKPAGFYVPVSHSLRLVVRECSYRKRKEKEPT